MECLAFSELHTSGEPNRPLTLILLKSVAIRLPFLSRYFCKSMPSSCQKVVYTPPICIAIRFPFVSRYFCRSIRVRGRWDTPQNPPEFAQPRLSRAKWHRSNTAKFVASHLGKTSHIGTNTPTFVPGNDRRLTYSNRAVQIRVGLELADTQQNLFRMRLKASYTMIR